MSKIWDGIKGFATELLAELGVRKMLGPEGQVTQYNVPEMSTAKVVTAGAFHDLNPKDSTAVASAKARLARWMIEKQGISEDDAQEKLQELEQFLWDMHEDPEENTRSNLYCLIVATHPDPEEQMNMLWLVASAPDADARKIRFMNIVNNPPLPARLGEYISKNYPRLLNKLIAHGTEFRVFLTETIPNAVEAGYRSVDTYADRELAPRIQAARVSMEAQLNATSQKRAKRRAKRWC